MTKTRYGKASYGNKVHASQQDCTLESTHMCARHGLCQAYTSQSCLPPTMSVIRIQDSFCQLHVELDSLV